MMIDDDDDIRTLFDAVDVPPSRVALGAIHAQGRRERTRRRVASTAGGVALAATLLAAVAVPYALHVHPSQTAPAATTVATLSPVAAPSQVTSAAQPLVCTPTAAKTAGDSFYNAYSQAVSPNGRYIAILRGPNTPGPTVLYTDGVGKVITVQGTVDHIYGVTSDGTVVGITNMTNNDPHVFRWKNGVTTILNLPLSYAAIPDLVHVNASGTIVAQAERLSTVNPKPTVNVLWHPGSTMGIVLPMPAGSGEAGILDNGDIVGNAGGSDGNSNEIAMVWDSAGRNGRLLPVPAGTTGSVFTSSGNWIIGGALVARVHGSEQTGTWTAVLAWNPATGEHEEFPDPTIGTAVNNSGDVVDANGQAYVEGRTTDLQPLKPNQQTVVVAVADGHQVIGSSGDTVVTWQC